MSQNWQYRATKRNARTRSLLPQNFWPIIQWTTFARRARGFHAAHTWYFWPNIYLFFFFRRKRTSFSPATTLSLESFANSINWKRGESEKINEFAKKHGLTFYQVKVRTYVVPTSQPKSPTFVTPHYHVYSTYSHHFWYITQNNKTARIQFSP